MAIASHLVDKTNFGNKSKTEYPPVVINTELMNTDISRLLQQRHRVRFSDTSIPSTCIFPLSAVAFMIVPLEQASIEWPPKSGRIQLDHGFMDRVKKFVQIHRNSYMIVTSALHSPHEIEVISTIQRRFINDFLKILPVHNESECVQTILTIAQGTCKPTNVILKSRLKAVLSQQSREQVALNILSQLGLNHHECMVLQQGCGTLALVATATQDQLLDCSLDVETAEKTSNFFTKDSYLEG